MSIENEVPLIKKDISMLTDKVDKIVEKVEEESRRAQAHREESLRFHSELLDKLDTRYAGRWVEKILIFIGSAIGIALIGAILSLIIIK